ncbi:hypothetical protein HZC08_00635 [Candidatus Micrarchaeota archaeon]|nr:hypothetical protein [Candidatus Micrarchaeota archaeon]
MKRCLFSNSLISNFNWKHGSEFTCYPCHEIKKSEKNRLNTKKRILSETVLTGFLLNEGLKKKARPREVRVKVDRRIIENDVGSSPEGETKNPFDYLLQTEDILHSISSSAFPILKRRASVYRLRYGKLNNH